MCSFNNPDCLNCPYDDCTASIKDIQRQWRHGAKDDIGQYFKAIKPPAKPKPIGTSYVLTRKYEQSEKGKARRRRYYQSAKGKELQKRYDQTEKGKERWRRYYRKKKEAANDKGYVEG